MYECNGYCEACDEACYACDRKNSCENYNDELTEEELIKREEQEKILREEKRRKRAEEIAEKNAKFRAKQNARISIENYIKQKTDEIISDYYKLGFDDRRVVKLFYFGIDYFVSEADTFYISGTKSPKNLMETVEGMTKKRHDKVFGIIKQIRRYGLGECAGMYTDYGDPYMSSFDRQLVGALNRNVRKVGQNYEIINHDRIVEKVINKPEVVNDYKEYVAKKLAEIDL